MTDLHITPVEELIDEIRRGGRILILDDRDETSNEGVVMVAAEHCTAEHVTFMARQARGLVCLGLTAERCMQLNLPPMVDRDDSDSPRFTLSIEAAQGIDTGISAADRALTVQVAVASHAQPADVVQPGHIFPLAAEAGGVLNRAGHTEAAVDYARIAGLTPAGVIADVLDENGELADGPALVRFVQEHGLKVGTVADLIQYRIANEHTIERIREGALQTAYGEFQLFAYRDTTSGDVHIALSQGDIDPSQPTLARVHASTTLRDIAASISRNPSWSAHKSLEAIAAAGRGVLVILGRSESDEQLISSLDAALNPAAPVDAQPLESYNTIGAGSQILRDLGVGKIRLMGPPIKYNAISGFGLEVTDFLTP
ncbi:MAG: 3,4-dihydroxy-2-butanone-4-phosphate synthase [Pseudomonadota bacterium]